MFITVPLTIKAKQLSFDDFLNGINKSYFEPKEDTRDTRTYCCTALPERLKNKYDVEYMIDILASFNSTYATLINTKDKSTLYKHYSIPKHSGGLRPIDEPKPELMNAQRALKFVLEKHLFASYHTSAFAYIKGRSTIDAIKRHQSNKSRWFLKLDFHNFFGSTTPKFVMDMLNLIYPYSEIIKSDTGRQHLETALSLCFLNGGLPQGTPISPTLTNLMMIPIDYEIAKLSREHAPHLCYTRYADDMLLSSEYNFSFTKVQDAILSILTKYGAPFTLNTTKTRYGSSAGRNWNLGVMLNKDNQITIGHQKKKQFKAMIFSFMADYDKDCVWSIEDVQTLQGIISYYTMVEGKVITDIVDNYSQKFNRSVKETIKEILTA